VPNLTLTIDADVLRRARIRAIHNGTSVNAVVRDFLESFAGQSEQLEARLRFVELAKQSQAGGDANQLSWRREDLYDERAPWPRS
jgi:plasmid stability protein